MGSYRELGMVARPFISACIWCMVQVYVHVERLRGREASREGDCEFLSVRNEMRYLIRVSKFRH